MQRTKSRILVLMLTQKLKTITENIQRRNQAVSFRIEKSMLMATLGLLCISEFDWDYQS